MTGDQFPASGTACPVLNHLELLTVPSSPAMQRFAPGNLAFLLLLFLGFPAVAQTRIEVAKSAVAASSSSSTIYRYLFENEKFTTQRVIVEFDESGHGKFSFTKKDSDEVTNELQVSRTLTAEVRALLEEMNFLDSTEDYQYKKDFSHLGNISITYARQGRERTVKFNYTSSQPLNRLVEIFRNIATQEERVFEIENVRAADPLSTPAQLRLLESELRSRRIAEPDRLAPLLEEIRLDEGLPLIARNHAERLLKSIRKSK